MAVASCTWAGRMCTRCPSVLSWRRANAWRLGRARPLRVGCRPELGSREPDVPSGLGFQTLAQGDLEVRARRIRWRDQGAIARVLVEPEVRGQTGPDVDARAYPEVSCEIVFEPQEWSTLYTMQHHCHPPPTPPPLREMVRSLARLGGFLARQGDGEPGIKAIWQGYQRLHEFIHAIDTYRTVHAVERNV
jgi:Transposase Tn5 dimerisation domain